MFSRMKNLFSKKHTPEPEQQPSEQGDKVQNTPTMRIMVDRIGVRVHRSNGKVEAIQWDEIGEVSLITTAEGPFSDDVYLCLHSIDDTTGCAIPSAAYEYEEIYNIVSQYEGFDFNNVITAMSCVTDAKFSLWKRGLVSE